MTAPAADHPGMPAPTADRSRTLATWLAVVGGCLGLHRFYLRGLADIGAWLLWLPSLTGLYGVLRMRALGQDDQLAWLLIPLLGLTIAATMLTAIRYGLMSDERWDARHNPDHRAASIGGLNVLGAGVALALGTIALMASIAFMAQRYFEHAAQTQPQSNSQRLAP
jgi:hypothetical protein